MGKVVKRKRRRVSIRGLATLMLSFALISWLASALIVNTINASLTMKIQSLNEELEMLKAENQTLNFEIQSLEDKDRVYEIASTANMGQITDNIISIVNGE